MAKQNQNIDFHYASYAPRLWSCKIKANVNRPALAPASMDKAKIDEHSSIDVKD